MGCLPVLGCAAIATALPLVTALLALDDDCDSELLDSSVVASFLLSVNDTAPAATAANPDARIIVSAFDDDAGACCRALSVRALVLLLMANCNDFLVTFLDDGGGGRIRRSEAFIFPFLYILLSDRIWSAAFARVVLRPALCVGWVERQQQLALVYY